MLAPWGYLQSELQHNSHFVVTAKKMPVNMIGCFLKRREETLPDVRGDMG